MDKQRLWCLNVLFISNNKLWCLFSICVCVCIHVCVSLPQLKCLTQVCFSVSFVCQELGEEILSKALQRWGAEVSNLKCLCFCFCLLVGCLQTVRAEKACGTLYKYCLSVGRTQTLALMPWHMCAKKIKKITKNVKTVQSLFFCSLIVSKSHSQITWLIFDFH